MEIFTKPSYSVGVTCKIQKAAADAQAKSERYLNRTKFVIAACCFEATMIEKADSGVTFEVRRRKLLTFFLVNNLGEVRHTAGVVVTRF